MPTIAEQQKQKLGRYKQGERTPWSGESNIERYEVDVDDYDVTVFKDGSVLTANPLVYDEEGNPTFPNWYAYVEAFTIAYQQRGEEITAEDYLQKQGSY